MQKKADEAIRSPHFVKYKEEDKIRNHYTHPDATRPLVEYVEFNYGKTPAEVRVSDFIYLDPGGPMFSNESSPPVQFYIDGIGFSVKKEHMIDVVDMIMSRRPLTSDPKFSKIYMAYAIAVLPEEMFDKITNQLYEYAKEATELQSEIRSVFERPPSPDELDSDIEASMILKDLIKLANSLDKEGMHKEADIVDNIIIRTADQIRMEQGQLKRDPGFVEQTRQKAWEQWKRLKDWGSLPPDQASQQFEEWFKSFFVNKPAKPAVTTLPSTRTPATKS